MAQLVREIMIEATPETIWPFLTEPDSLVEWHGTVAEIDPRPGGIYRVLVAGQFQSAGEYVEVVPMEKVVFTFGWEQDGHPIPPGSTTIARPETSFGSRWYLSLNRSSNNGRTIDQSSASVALGARRLMTFDRHRAIKSACCAVRKS